MASARNEAPKGPREGGVEGVPAPYRWRSLERGLCPSQNFVSIFKLKMASCGAFWELILLQLNRLSYTHKPVSLDFGM